MEEEDYIDELDDIFDGEAIENNDEGNVEESNEVANPADPEGAEKVAVPKRRIVRHPRLKFNPDRLCGDRGIPILVDHFKDVKFKGKGHEVEDLDRLLAKLEHWTHRLFPSMKFLDCLRHIENLGKKRPVQVCVSKIRMDMPILNNDFISGENDDVRRGSDSDTSEVALGTEFDQLMAAYQQTQTEGGNTFSDLDSEDDDISPSNSQMTPDQNLDATTSVSNELTEEQKQRIEQNRKLAAERLKARQSGLNASSLSAKDEMTNNNKMMHNPSVSNKNQLSDNKTSSLHSNDSDDDYSKFKTVTIDSDDDCDDDVNIDDLVENSFQPPRKHILANVDSDSSDDASQIYRKKNASLESESDDSNDYIKSTKKSEVNKDNLINKSTESWNKNTLNNNLDSHSGKSKFPGQRKKRRKIKIDSDDDDSDNQLKPPTNTIFNNIDSEDDDSQEYHEKSRNLKIDSDDDDVDLKSVEISADSNENDNLLKQDFKPPTNTILNDEDSDAHVSQTEDKKTENLKIYGDNDVDNLVENNSDDVPRLHRKKNRKIQIDSDDDFDAQLKSVEEIATCSNEDGDVLKHNFKPSTNTIVNNEDSNDHNLERGHEKVKNMKVYDDNNIDNLMESRSDSDDHHKKNKIQIESDEDDDINDTAISSFVPSKNHTLNDSDKDDNSQPHFKKNRNTKIDSDDDDVDNVNNNINKTLKVAEFDKAPSSDNENLVTPSVTDSQQSENSTFANAKLESESDDTKLHRKQIKRPRIVSDEDSESN